MLPVGMATTKEEIAREQARQAAIDTMDASWIDLKLLDRKHRRMGAIETVVAREVLDSETNEAVYMPEVISGDEKFRRTGLNAWRCRILDTEFNREFLASHHALGWWEVMDADIRADVEQRSRRMAAESRYELPPAPTADLSAHPQTAPDDLSDMDDEQIDKMLAAAKKEKAKRRKPKKRGRKQQQEENGPSAQSEDGQSEDGQAETADATDEKQDEKPEPVPAEEESGIVTFST